MARPLWNRCLLRALYEPAHVLSGSVATLAATILWNPLPLVLWLLGSAAWLVRAMTSPDLAKRVLREEAEAREALRRQEQLESLEALVQKQRATRVVGLIQSGRLPDLAADHRRLVQLASEIARSSRERPELELEWNLGLRARVDELLEAHLRLAHERLDLFGGTSGGLSPNERLAQARREVARVDALIAHEPAAAGIRRSHRVMLLERVAQLEGVVAREQQLAAELEALPTIFATLVERLTSGSRTEVSTPIDELVPRLEAGSSLQASPPRDRAH